MALLPCASYCLGTFQILGGGGNNIWMTLCLRASSSNVWYGVFPVYKARNMYDGSFCFQLVLTSVMQLEERTNSTEQSERISSVHLPLPWWIAARYLNSGSTLSDLKEPTLSPEPETWFLNKFIHISYLPVSHAWIFILHPWQWSQMMSLWGKYYQHSWSNKILILKIS